MTSKASGMGSADRHRDADRSAGMGRTGTNYERRADERDAYVSGERDRETDTTGTGHTRADASDDRAAMPRNPGANFGEVDLGRTDESSDTGANRMHDDVGATGTDDRHRSTGGNA